MAELRVLDTSVVTKWFFLDEPLRERALTIRADLVAHPDRYVVPPLFFSEFAHVMARKSDRDELFVVDALRLVLRLGIRAVSLSESGMLRMCHWSCQGLSGYDATFVALAEELGGRWITADVRAAGQTRGIAEPLDA